jgi:hypothetical protein
MTIKEKMQENKNVLWGAVAVVIIIILLIVLGGKKDGGEEVMLDENGNPVEQTEGEMTALSPAEPIVSGDYEYAFSGVEWMFDTEDPLVVGTGNTHLKMMFADFTRNGNAITFGRPYKLGFHPGTCESMEFLDTTDVAGIPLAYAKCSDGKTTREFAVLQEAEKVTVKMNEKVGEEETGFQDWYKIDVTEIVK